MEELIIRKAKPAEVAIFIDRAGKEGWNPGIHDGEAFYAADPDGWFVATAGEEIAGTLVLTNYDDSFSFGGFFIIKEEFRHRGAGWKLWSTAIKHVGDRNLGGDGVYEMQDKYTKNAGFKFAYRNIRWEGTAAGKLQEELIEVKDLAFRDILDYDSLHFPSRREDFLEKWLNMPDSTALAYTGAEGRVSGYGVIRKCLSGHKIGPLFAETTEIAEILLDGLTSTIENETFYLDTPELNLEAVKIARQRHMNEVFGTARIYTGNAPKLPLENIFGVTSFELG
ncbi:MAG: GNAT family N-acetyltransferase [Methanomicrobiaceae archaeon]|nr:GNAT family N-acetyltransferase [Methanomicrobiaceae archaeon]